MATTPPMDKNIETKKSGIKQATRTDGNTWGVIHAHHYNNLENPNKHKALDFSNVNLYPTDGNSYSETTVGSDYDMRRFHQMVIYTSDMMITSNLPERVQYSLNSVWQEPLAFNNALTNLLFQAQSGIKTNKRGKRGLISGIDSGINRAGTVRIWGGTQPLSMQVTIPVLDDNMKASGANLVEALEQLGKLCLPNLNGDSGWYTPPPNPLSLSVVFNKTFATKEESDKGAKETLYIGGKNQTRIMIQLGGILLIDRCVIESVSVDYPDTKTMILHDYSKDSNGPADKSTGERYLHPLLANVTIKFSTVEAMTSDRYSAMLWAKEQKASFIADYTSGMSGNVEGNEPGTVNNENTPTGS